MVTIVSRARRALLVGIGVLVGCAPIAAAAPSGQSAGGQVTLSVTVQLSTGAGVPGAAVVSVTTGGQTTRCTTSCHVAVAPGTQVTLTAQVGHGYQVDGWSAPGFCPNAGSSVCRLVAPATDLALILVLRPATYTLSVQPAGAGTIVGGDPTVASGNSIDCTRTNAGDLVGTCAAQWPAGASVTLQAEAFSPAHFKRWSVYECPGQAAQCTIVMNANRTVTAIMDRVPFVVRRLGTGGRITSTPPGIDCGPDCSSAMATFPFGTALTLTAQPDPASSFGGWSDPCGGPNPVCTLRLLAFSSVSATFGSLAPPVLAPGLGSSRVAPAAAGTYAVDLSVSGNGAVLLGRPRGGYITCRRHCALGGYQLNQTAPFTAIPGRRWALARWDDGCGRQRSCSLPPYVYSSVRAVFRRRRRR